MKRAVLAVAVLLVVVAAAAAGTGYWYLNGDAVRAQAEAAFRRATGRELTLAGPIRIGWSLRPTLTASDLRIANPPGFSRPDLARAARVSARLALWPLLSRRLELEQVSITAPQIWLERSAQGAVNWNLAPAPSSGPAGPPQAGGGGRFALAVHGVDVTDAEVTWVAPAPLTVTAPRFVLDPATGAVAGDLITRGTSFHLSGIAPGALKLEGGGVVATLEGSHLAVAAADLAALSGLAGQPLPPLRDVALQADVTASGPTALRLAAGRSTMGGLALQSLAAQADSMAAPVTLQATLAIGALPMAVNARAESLAGLLAGNAPTTLTASAEGATMTGSGILAAGGTATIALQAHVADMAALGTRAGLALPALRDATLAGTLRLAPGAVTIDALKLASAQGDLEGNLRIATSGRRSVTGALSSARIELAALLPPAAPPSAPPASAPAAPAAPPDPRVLPDTPIPFALLQSGDADLQLHLAQAVWRSWTLSDLELHAVAKDGRLALDPAGASFGAKRLQGRASADAASTSLALTMNGTGLPAGALVAAAGGPAGSGGTVDLALDLRAHGATVRALAGSLDGAFGLAVIDASVPHSWIEAMAANLSRAIGVGVEAGAAATTVRCLAVRATASSGKLLLAALALDTPEVALSGSGEANLADETLDLHLRPSLRVGTTLAVPLKVGGTFRAPKVGVEAGAIVPGRFGLTIGGGQPADPCGPALAAARGGAAGPAPAPAAATRPIKPADLLRSLLR